MLELEKVQRRAACFVHNNYWCDTNDLYSRLGDILEARRQKSVSMLYKAINGLTAIPMDHYVPTLHGRFFHGQNYYLPVELTYTNIPIS